MKFVEDNVIGFWNKERVKEGDSIFFSDFLSQLKDIVERNSEEYSGKIESVCPMDFATINSSGEIYNYQFVYKKEE